MMMKLRHGTKQIGKADNRLPSVFTDTPLKQTQPPNSGAPRSVRRSVRAESEKLAVSEVHDGEVGETHGRSELQDPKVLRHSAHPPSNRKTESSAAEEACASASQQPSAVVPPAAPLISEPLSAAPAPSTTSEPLSAAPAPSTTSEPLCAAPAPSTTSEPLCAAPAPSTTSEPLCAAPAPSTTSEPLCAAPAPSTSEPLSRGLPHQTIVLKPIDPIVAVGPAQQRPAPSGLTEAKASIAHRVADNEHATADEGKDPSSPLSVSMSSAEVMTVAIDSSDHSPDELVAALERIVSDVESPRSCVKQVHLQSRASEGSFCETWNERGMRGPTTYFEKKDALLSRIASSRVEFVAHMQGNMCGIGTEVALVCRTRVAPPVERMDALRLGFVEEQYGVYPSGVALWSLMQDIPLRSLVWNANNLSETMTRKVCKFDRSARSSTVICAMRGIFAFGIAAWRGRTLREASMGRSLQFCLRNLSQPLFAFRSRWRKCTMQWAEETVAVNARRMAALLAPPPRRRCERRRLPVYTVYTVGSSQRGSVPMEEATPACNMTQNFALLCDCTTTELSQKASQFLQEAWMNDRVVQGVLLLLVDNRFFNVPPSMKEAVSKARGAFLFWNCGQEVYEARSVGKTGDALVDELSFPFRCVLTATSSPLHALPAGVQLQAAVWCEASRLAAASSIQTVDRVARNALGMRLGPFEVMDVFGADAVLAVVSALGASTWDWVPCPLGRVAEQLTRDGCVGHSCARGGFYAHSGSPEISTAACAALESSSSEKEIADRLLYSAFQCCCEMLVNGTLKSAEDAEVLATAVLDVAPSLGGILWRGGASLEKTCSDLESLACIHGKRFAPSPLLKSMIEHRENFACLSQEVIRKASAHK